MCSFWLTRIDHISSLSVRESKNTSHIFAQLLFFSLHHCAAPFLYRLKWQVIVSENQSYNFYTLLAAFLKWWKQFGPFKTSGPHLSMFWEIKWPANQKIISDCGRLWPTVGPGSKDGNYLNMPNYRISIHPTQAFIQVSLLCSGREICMLSLSTTFR